MGVKVWGGVAGSGSVPNLLACRASSGSHPGRGALQYIEAAMPYLVNFGPDYAHDVFVSHAHGPLITRWSQEFAADLAV
jgi:hypothetical protein